jgi:hypothetical protein
MKKKVKKYAGGGLSGIASEATSLMGAADNAASAINTIRGGAGDSPGSMGDSGKLGFLQSAYKQYMAQQPQPAVENPSQNLGTQVQPYKKGGKVSSASKRADGIAIRGKTRA